MAPAPIFDVPAGSAAQVYIVDSGVRGCNFPTGILVDPPVTGFDMLPPTPAWSFLVESSTGQKVVFDLSMPPETETYPPVIANMLKATNIFMTGKYHVADVLSEHGVNPADISSVIWR
jgi:hypothetical protein